MEISMLLELFSNDGLTCAERVEFSKWKVNRLKVEQLPQFPQDHHSRRISQDSISYSSTSKTI